MKAMASPVKRGMTAKFVKSGERTPSSVARKSASRKRSCLSVGRCNTRSFCRKQKGGIFSEALMPKK
jgi:hypothetical protein